MAWLTDEEIEQHLLAGTKEQELRDALGDEVYDALRAEAVAALEPVGVATDEFLGFGSDDKPFVYILPGIMGSKLSARKGNDSDLVWFDPIDIRNGGVAKLKFGAEPNPIVATGTFWSAYGLMRIRLSAQGHKVRFLPYDWRRSIADIGNDLLASVEGNGPHGAVLVAHSMGGLVARQMAANDAAGLIKRVVTIGTPNHGSYSPVQVFRVSSDMLSKIGWLDKKHTPTQIAKLYLRYFPGLVEMMPDPSKRPGEEYFTLNYWPGGGATPTKGVLTSARSAKSDLPAPDDRFRQIVGYGQKTVVGASKVDNELEYRYSSLGDGTVPLDLAQVSGVPQYFVDDTHAGMMQRGDVVRAAHDLIVTGSTSAVSNVLPTTTIADEATAERRTDTEVRKENQAAETPENATAQDVLSEFLSVPSNEAGAGSFGGEPEFSTAGELGGLDLSRRISGYPLSVLLRASQTWGESEAAPAPDGMPTIEAVIPKERETDTRKQKYAARKLQQLREFVAEVPQRDVLPDRLRAIVAKANIRPIEAINELLDERVMGEAEEFLSVLYLKRAPIVSKSVGRIIRRNTSTGFGTGFLVAPGVLITNHHVLQDAAAASIASVEFDYEINYRNREMQPERFRFRPDLLFYANEALDFALVAVEQHSFETGRPLTDFGYLPLDGGEGKITIGNPVNVIQHPNAEQKQAVFREAELLGLPANELAPDAQFTGAPADVAAHYTADTKPGSSGSPVLSDAWEVIALHHSAVAVVRNGEFLMKDGSFRHPNQINSDKDVDWQANEGIRISRITRHLQDVLEGPPANMGTSALVGIDSVLRVGKHANGFGHFARPMPVPVLSQDEPPIRPESFAMPPFGSTSDSGVVGQETGVGEFESLIDRLRDIVSRIDSRPSGGRAVRRSGGALSVDSAGVATGSGGLDIHYRGSSSSPYGKSATRNKRPFNSIVLHHNDPRHSTDWLINYQIVGDVGRNGHFGYHFYIDPAGVVFQGAPLTKRTNHVKPLSMPQRKKFGRIATNSSAVGVTCVAAGNTYTPTAAQLQTQDQLVRALADHYQISLSNVFGHGELQTDRHANEGTAPAKGFRGASIGAVAPVFDDDMDDSPLEGFGGSDETIVGDGHEAFRGGHPVEDDDDISVGAILEGHSAGSTVESIFAGAKTAATQLAYTNGAAIRNKPCTSNMEVRLVEAVEATFGPGCRIEIYSGGQDRPGPNARRTGSIRHDDFGQGGRGADVYVFNPSGGQIRALELAKLGQYWLAARIGCVGHEMGGGGIHLDEWVPPPQGGGRYWTYAASDAEPWGPQARAMLARGAAGQFP